VPREIYSAMIVSSCIRSNVLFVKEPSAKIVWKAMENSITVTA